LIQTPAGNLPWDCVGLIDDPTVARIEERGHIAEIAISHPHYDTSLVEEPRVRQGDHSLGRQGSGSSDPPDRYPKAVHG
jgi:hypothetical protein